MSIQMKRVFFTDDKVHVKCLIFFHSVAEVLTEGQPFPLVLSCKGLYQLILVKPEINCLMEDSPNDALGIAYLGLKLVVDCLTLE
jgi:hypothetical protein